ncbi:MAG TPA: hypothetical protein PKJ45_07110 [Rubrivivax sp.]|nr:hypothetical protein [Burkholderiales bacterium]HNU11119.1 hypothetical protein [Rubrivivax sp.]
MDSQALGRYVLPAMEELPRRIPKLIAAVLCTPDGFNICSLGVDERQVGKLAALSGSLLAVGDATLAELNPDAGRHAMDLLTLKAGDFQVLGVKVQKPGGHLILMGAAQETTLGVMIVGMQAVAAAIEKLFTAA